MNPLAIRMTRLGSTTWVENCIEVTREKLTSDFKALMDDVQELLKTTSNQTGESIVDLRQRLGQKLAVTARNPRRS